ncbi:fumarylacetoacetate hydrolase family protein [Salinibacterium sp. SYSU T00001]|uniref:fumarylacetoacetate hydrolase family protein n=1 Tax=Homoserinimonas sedimenticola TaxID=2986805 RepID=UPI002235D431|nr:fumarylacetoacetate hydrolase family protein [Salinibacterium sedimenticola]MCW4386586.1 fumarylacetoacetate hydrolase family protein [Salinibacterium sedimenticola]
MKIARIDLDGTERWGVIDDDVIRTSDSDIPLAELAAAQLDRSVPRSDTRLLAPVDVTSKVLCVGLNYRDHILEMGRELPSHPVLFTRFPDSLVGPEEPLVLPRASEEYDYEGELAIVIGRHGRAIAEENTLDHVLGYTLLNDGSLRDFQRHTIRFTAGKNFEASGAIGPWIVTRDEVGLLSERRIRTRVNGEVRQESDLGQFVFDVSRLVSYISTWTPLRPGDIIATGTPAGVGASFDPPKWLRAGDRVEIDVDGIGTLANPVVAEGN